MVAAMLLGAVVRSLLIFLRSIVSPFVIACIVMAMLVATTRACFRDQIQLGSVSTSQTMAGKEIQPMLLLASLPLDEENG
jgi:hypothetical protein